MVSDLFMVEEVANLLYIAAENLDQKVYLVRCLTVWVRTNRS